MTNFDKDNRNDDMSMEDILASIRKYVSGDGENNQSKGEQKQDTSVDINQDEVVINLEKSQIADPSTKNIDPKEVVEKELSNVMYTKSETLVSNTNNPFERLTNTLKECDFPKKQDKNHKMLTIDKFLEQLATPMIEKWLDSNLEQIIERVVDKEIEKLKDEC
jgi:cell pole-organizing protein PopZ